MATILLILFVIIPIIEIYLFIEIGGAIGTGWTLLLIIATAFFGLRAMRRQGMAVLAEAQAAQLSGQPPVAAAAHGVLILMAGALLLTPGFFTDSIGFLLLWRPARSLVLETALGMILPFVTNSFKTGPKAAGQQTDPGKDPFQSLHREQSDSRQADIIEGEFRIEDDK